MNYSVKRRNEVRSDSLCLFTTHQRRVLDVEGEVKREHETKRAEQDPGLYTAR